MPFTVTMPKLSPTMEKGVIVKWHKKEGEYVESGDLLIEISTDKATVEHEALDPGWLKKIVRKEGDEANVNDPLAIFTEEKDQSIENYEYQSVQTKQEKVEEKEASEGEVPSPKKQKETVGLQQPAFVPEAPLEEYQFAFPREQIQDRIKASPLARKIAEEKGLDLTSVKGTGPGGRVVEKDLSKAQTLGPAQFNRKEIPTIPPGTFKEEPLSQIRKVVAERLQSSKTFIPHFYVHQTVDASGLVQLYQQLKELGIKVTYNDLVVRACALALREFPEVNSGYNSVNQTFIRYQTVDISVAVDTPEGLITPIIRHADYKNLAEISAETKELALRARAGSLKLHEFKGGSFSVSNLGMFGVSSFEAVINPPQAAICAVGGIEETPVVKDGSIIPGKTLKLSFSFDHRVIDGALGAKFVKAVQRLIEQPITLAI
ncbi:MAG: pyruvate dehydrogenase complex dihydrolipoamide acetyltransferase [Waddliaceae bacterium]